MMEIGGNRTEINVLDIDCIPENIFLVFWNHVSARFTHQAIADKLITRLDMYISLSSNRKHESINV